MPAAVRRVTCIGLPLLFAACVVQPLAPAPAPERPPAPVDVDEREFDFRLQQIIDADPGFVIALDVEHERAFTASEMTLRHWDLATGTLLAEHRDRGSGDDAWANADMTRVAMRNDDRISVWANVDGSMLAEWRAPAAAEHMELSRDGGQLVTSSPDGRLDLWDAATGSPLATWSVPAGDQPSFARLPSARADTRLLTQSAGEGPAILWSIPDAVELARLPAGKAIGRDHVLGGQGQCRVWRAEDGAPWLDVAGVCVQFSDDERFVLTREGHRWQRWSLADRKLTGSVQIDNWGYSHALSTDGRLLAVDGEFDVNQLWDLDKGRLRLTLPYAPRMHFTATELILAGHTIHRVDLASGEIIQRIDGAHGFLAIGADALYTDDDALNRWSLADGQRSWRAAEQLRVRAPELDPQGQRIVAGSKDGLVVWDAQTGQQLERCEDLGEVIFVHWLSATRVVVSTASSTFPVDLGACTTGPAVESFHDDFHPLPDTVAIEPGRQRLALPTEDGIWLFDAHDAGPIPGTELDSAVDWGSDGLLALIGRRLRVVTSDGVEVRVLDGPADAGPADVGPANVGTGLGLRHNWTDVALSPSGQVAVIDGESLLLYTDETDETDAPARELPLPISSIVDGHLSFDPSGRWLLVVLNLQDRRALRIYDASDASMVWALGDVDDPDAETVVEYAWHVPSASLLVASNEHDLLRVEPGSWQTTPLFAGDRGLRDIDVSADGGRALLLYGEQMWIFDVSASAAPGGPAPGPLPSF